VPCYNSDIKLCLNETSLLLKSGALMLHRHGDVYCICHNTYDPGISPGSANQCILGDVCLRSKRHGVHNKGSNGVVSVTDAVCKYLSGPQRSIRPFSALMFDCHAYPVMAYERMGAGFRQADNICTDHIGPCKLSCCVLVAKTSAARLLSL